jgi:CheY-like chemotaxis protein
LAQKENLCHPNTCRHCSYRQNWLSKRYDLQEYLSRSGQQRKRPKTHRILAIDDEPDFLFGLEETLLDMGCTILTAVDGDEGLLFAQETIPDLIITDVQMPGMNGFELCRALKSDPKTSAIPIIIASVLATKREEEEGLKAGATAYIVKPFHLLNLVTQVRRLIPLPGANLHVGRL